MIDKILVWLAWRLPRKIVYFAAIRLMSSATVGKYADSALSKLLAEDALRQWNDKIRGNYEN